MMMITTTMPIFAALEIALNRLFPLRIGITGSCLITFMILRAVHS